MGFFKRDSNEGSEDQTSESVSDPASQEQLARASQGTPRGGIVSAVWGDKEEESADTPYGDIVERRFGPRTELPPARQPETATIDTSPASIETSSKDVSAALIETPTKGTSAALIETPTKDSDTTPVVVAVHELETPDLEIDSMAHIGRSTTINGDIVSEEDLEIEGTVEGTVTLSQHRVTIGAEGVVKARVQAESVIVVGRIEGDVSASSLVEVKPGGFIGGNVQSPRVILQDGAIVIGGLDMSAALPKGATEDVRKPGKKASKPKEPVIDSPLLVRVDPPKMESSVRSDGI